MAPGIIQRLREAQTSPRAVTRADFDLSDAAAGQREQVATTKLRRPHALRTDVPVDVAVMAYEEFTSDGTADNTETYTLSHDLVESGATDTDVVAFEGNSTIAVDAIDYENDSVDITASGTDSTIGVFYAAGDQARVILRKRDPKDNDESLWSGDVGLLHQRDHAKDPVYLSFDSTLQAVVPTNWHLDVYVDAPYQAAYALDVGGDGDDEEPANALATFPTRQATDRIGGLSKAVKHDRDER